MKNLFLAFCFWISFSAQAKETVLLDCTVAKIYNGGDFKKLSSKRNLKIYLLKETKKGRSSLSLTFGALASFDTSKGDIIQQAKDLHRTRYKARYKHQKWTMTLDVSDERTIKNKRWGEFRFREDPRSSEKVIARIFCK